jgi:phosphatidylserine/phosphatidylglycerophosphate/cardiolipin synthase-like enzyme
MSFLNGFNQKLIPTLGIFLFGQLQSAYSSTAQLVQTVPVETDLAQPGIQSTAEVWIDLAKKAKVSIDLAQFFVSAEPKGNSKVLPLKRLLDQVIDELELASKRGVKIRLLLSKSLVSEDPSTLDRFKKMRGSSIRIYDMSRLSGGVLHAKYWIIDRKEVFIGSQNFDWRALQHTHELGVRLENIEIARQLGRIFDLDWKMAKSEEAPNYDVGTWSRSTPVSQKAAELVTSPQSLNPSDIRPSLHALLEILTSAKKSLKIQLLDYSPVSGNDVYWPDLDDAIRAAAIRGVKVQILLANGPTTLRALNYLKSLSLIPRVEIRLVTIPPFSGGLIPHARMIHSKYMMADDEVLWLGTSNWSRGYFYNSRNVELILRMPDLTQSADQVFQKLWNSRYVEKIEINKTSALAP